MNTFFPEIRKNFGFGCMRFPKIDGEADIPQIKDMVDAFLEAGFNYFDTLKFYMDGQSEQIVKACLTSRYPRDCYVLTDKLSVHCFKTKEDVLPLFQEQLDNCGVDYFDFYFYHALKAERHKFFTEEGIYDIGKQLLASGKIRHLGMSFHDTADVLDQILTEHPEIEVVQLQFNYVDYLDPKIQSRECYEVCRKHGKPVMVMEPVKGGALANLPDGAADLMTQGSPASYALRYAASFENVIMVLSGMSSMEQVRDNIATMRDFKPLTQDEHRIIDQVRTIYQSQNKIPCTSCRYCVEDCPAGLDIPALFACLNDKHQNVEGAEERYAAQAVPADACIGCGHCETVCPQGLHIRQLLKDVVAGF